MKNRRNIKVPDGKKVIFRPFKDLPNGRRIYAHWYNLKAFPFIVDEE